MNSRPAILLLILSRWLWLMSSVVPQLNAIFSWHSPKECTSRFCSMWGFCVFVFAGGEKNAKKIVVYGLTNCSQSGPICSTAVGKNCFDKIAKQFYAAPVTDKGKEDHVCDCKPVGSMDQACRKHGSSHTSNRERFCVILKPYWPAAKSCIWIGRTQHA